MYDAYLLSRVPLTNIKAIMTLIETNVKITLSDGTLLYDPTLYCQLVESLVFYCTLLDIKYVVHIVI
jgi:hypothetical protein